MAKKKEPTLRDRIDAAFERGLELDGEEAAAALGANPKKVIRSGPVLEVLKQVLREEKADLLVLGHEGRSFFEKVLFGGEVEDQVQELIQQTGVPVLVVK